MRNGRLTRASVCGVVVGASFLGALLVASQTAAQYSTPQAGSATVKVASVGITGTSATGYAFQPRKLKVKAGTKGAWAWQSDAPHNVIFGKLGKHSMTGQSGTFKLRFKHAGTFRYFCSVHGFSGKIVVHK